MMMMNTTSLSLIRSFHFNNEVYIIRASSTKDKTYAKWQRRHCCWKDFCHFCRPSQLFNILVEV